MDGWISICLSQPFPISYQGTLKHCLCSNHLIFQHILGQIALTSLMVSSSFETSLVEVTNPLLPKAAWRMVLTELLNSLFALAFSGYDRSSPPSEDDSVG